MAREIRTVTLTVNMRASDDKKTYVVSAVYGMTDDKSLVTTVPGMMGSDGPFAPSPAIPIDPSKTLNQIMAEVKTFANSLIPVKPV